MSAGRRIDATLPPWIAVLILSGPGPVAAAPWPWPSLEPGPEDKALIDAKAALEAKEPARAQALLEAAPQALPELRAFLQAKAEAALGHSTEAAARLTGIALRKPLCATGAGAHPLEIEAARLRAELIADQAPLEAAELLLSLPADGDSFARAAALYRSAGQGAKALAVEARMLVELADWPAAKRLARALKAEGVAQRLSAAQRLGRVRHLLETQLNAEARTEAVLLLADSAADAAMRCELSFIAGKASRKLRDYKAAIRALSEARSHCEAAKNEELGLRAALLEVQVRAIRGDAAGGEKVLGWMKRRAPGHSFVDDAELFLANLHDDAGRTDAAAKLYQSILDGAAGSDSAPEAAWRLAYLDLRRGERALSTKRLEQLVAQGGSGQDAARARYWLARNLEEEAPERARALYEEAALDLSFYGWLSLDHLERARPAWREPIAAKLLALRGAPAPAAALPAALRDAPEVERARRYASIDEPLYAEMELARLECEGLSDADALALALVMDAAGAHPRAQRLLRARSKSMLGPLSAANVAAYRAAYSRPFREPLEKAAGEAKVEPLFLFALSREESTFDPAIISWAGAVGLTQLMPDTAMGMYQALEKKRLDLDRLIEPELNLRLGARVLKDGMRKFQNVEALALVAYNAGPGAAKKMIDPEAKPFDRWVEEISIRETRKYVKRVSETWGIYRFLYDDAHPFVRFPERIGG